MKSLKWLLSWGQQKVKKPIFYSDFPFVEKPREVILDNFALYFTKGEKKHICHCDIFLKVKENTKS